LLSRSVKMRFLLPAVQLGIAIGLLVLADRDKTTQDLYIPTSALVCTGINAPANLLRAVAWTIILQMPDRAPPRTYGLPRLFFLVGVGVTWYLVGRAADSRICGKTRVRATLTLRDVLVSAGLALLAVLLLVVSLQRLFSGYWRFRNAGEVSAVLLTLAWGLALTVVSIVRITKAVRMRARV